MSAINEFKKLLAEAASAQKKVTTEIREDYIIPDSLTEEETIAQKTAKYLNTNNDNSPAPPKDIEAQRWNDPLRRDPAEKFVTFKEMNDHYTNYLGRIQQQLSSLGGGGEVLFRNLDDIDRSTIGPNRHLAYNATTKKFFFEDVSNGSDLLSDGVTTSIANNTISVINLPNTNIGPIQTLTSGNLIPAEDDTFTLGNPDFRWKSIHLGAGTIFIEDTEDPNITAALRVTNGVLTIDGANQLQVGQLKFVDNTIQSTIANVDIQIGQVDSEANLVFNRDVVMADGKTITNVDFLSFDVDHTHQENRVPGTLCWDPEDLTLNLTHPSDVVQQIGQELYGKVRNETGTLIPNGTVVRFDGASMNGSARLEVAPFLADGAFPSLFGFGVTTQDISDGADGLVTVWGKIRDINTTGSSVSESWQIGDILYASPTVAGAFTKVKPTAPNNVVPMAAVLRVDAAQGEIFVRPTINQKMSYARFARTTDLTGLSANTATAVTFDTTTISNGVTLADAGTSIQVDQSGYYQISVSAQLDTNSNKGVSYMWIRRNGNNVADTTRREAIESSDDIRTFAYTQDLSLNANDKVQLMVAVTNSDLRFDAAAATVFAPSTASFIVSVTQVQL